MVSFTYRSLSADQSFAYSQLVEYTEKIYRLENDPNSLVIRNFILEYFISY